MNPFLEGRWGVQVWIYHMNVGDVSLLHPWVKSRCWGTIYCNSGVSAFSIEGTGTVTDIENFLESESGRPALPTKRFSVRNGTNPEKLDPTSESYFIQTPSPAPTLKLVTHQFRFWGKSSHNGENKRKLHLCIGLSHGKDLGLRPQRPLLQLGAGTTPLRIWAPSLDRPSSQDIDIF
jgi:hypothetical protein